MDPGYGLRHQPDNKFTKDKVKKYVTPLEVQEEPKETGDKGGKNIPEISHGSARLKMDRSSHCETSEDQLSGFLGKENGNLMHRGK